MIHSSRINGNLAAGSPSSEAFPLAETRIPSDPGLFPKAGSPDSLSPALQTRNLHSLPAYELKFVMSTGGARQLADLLQGSLQTDPHGPVYGVSTLYFETPAWDVFHRQGVHRESKLRLRRYGDSPVVFLEQKTKVSGSVSKRRTAIPLHRLADLSQNRHVSQECDWFQQTLTAGALRPACRLSYLRQASFGTLEGHPVRVTFDHSITAVRQSEWSLEEECPPVLLFPDSVVVEVKYLVALPTIVKSALQACPAAKAGCSKYRHAVRVLQLADQEPTSHA